MITVGGLEGDSVQEQDMGQEPSILFKAKPRCQLLAETWLAQAAVSMPLSLVPAPTPQQLVPDTEWGAI